MLFPQFSFDCAQNPQSKWEQKPACLPVILNSSGVLISERGIYAASAFTGNYGIEAG